MLAKQMAAGEPVEGHQTKLQGEPCYMEDH